MSLPTEVEEKYRTCLFGAMASLDWRIRQYLDDNGVRSRVHRDLLERMLWPAIDKYYGAIEVAYRDHTLQVTDARLELVIFTKKEWIELSQRINTLERLAAKHADPLWRDG
jgi:hypothetical protein